MSYDVNTSKTHRLPINFYWDLYENIPELEDYILSMQEDAVSGDQEYPYLPMLMRVLEGLKRQRRSHRGNEEL